MRAFLIALMLCAPAMAFADQMETAALSAINAARAKAGCAALAVNPKLQKAAAGHAAAMAKQNFFSHTGKDGSKLKGRIDRTGYRWGAIAENIAAGQPSAGEVVATWLGSAGHKKNMLNCTYTETGLAVAYQPDDKPLNGNSYPFKYYWVQVFGRP
ncbi:MAG: CAP domain-containing protein [Cypionkella sp.]|nr:CAP domain-containing protein [Cypionkella sp.]